MLRVWIGGWRHVEHLDPTKAHTGENFELAGYNFEDGSFKQEILLNKFKIETYKNQTDYIQLYYYPGTCY